MSLQEEHWPLVIVIVMMISSFLLLGITKASLSAPSGVTIVSPTAGLIQLSWLPVAGAEVSGSSRC